MRFKAGDLVGLSCEVKPGPFSEEMLVTVETVDGAISGFVQRSELRETNGFWQVRAQVRHISNDSVEVWIRGSFLTTNGLATVSPHLAMAA